MLTRLYEHGDLNLLWRITDWCYSSPSSLLVTSQGSVVATILSERGIRQACVLGGLLFCLAIHPVYESVLKGVPSSAAAYIDDFNFSCPPEHAPGVISRLVPLLRGLDLELAPNKCNVLWPRLSPPPQIVIDFTNEFKYNLHKGILPILGSAIGFDRDALVSFAMANLAKHSRILDTLTHPSMPAQHAFVILRLCHVSTANFLLRTLPPSIVTPACIRFDKDMWSAALRKLDVDPDSVSHVAQVQLALPLRYGGLALRSTADTAPCAYLAALAALHSTVFPISTSTDYIINNGLVDCYRYFSDKGISLAFLTPSDPRT